MAVKKLSVPKIIAIVVAAVLVILIAAGSIYCVSTDQNPSEAAKSIFSGNEEQIVGKWQSQKNPGLSAFVFYEDGTYDSYISTANFSGNYEIDGNKLTLNNPSTAKEIVYKFKVNEKELSLTLYEEDGEEAETKEVSAYDRVDELNQKSLADLIGELKESQQATTEKE